MKAVCTTIQGHRKIPSCTPVSDDFLNTSEAKILHGYSESTADLLQLHICVFRILVGENLLKKNGCKI